MRNLLKSALDFSSFQINPTKDLRELCQHLGFALGLPEPIKIHEGYLVKVEIGINDEPLTFESSNKNSKAARRMASLEALSVLRVWPIHHFFICFYIVYLFMKLVHICILKTSSNIIIR